MNRIALVLIIAVSYLGRAAIGGEPAGDAPLSADQVTALIAGLNNDSFNVREAATERLTTAGRHAIPHIVDAVSDNDLEVTTRLLRVLGQLALSEQPATSADARAALEKIAATRVTSAATRAAETLATLDEIREERCLAQLKRLGATVERHTYAFGNNAVDLSYTIEIDKRWKGESDEFKLLGNVPHVRHLVLNYPEVDDDWMSVVAELSNLEDLTIVRGKVTSAGIADLSKLERLQTLEMMYTPMIDDGAVDSLRAMQGVVMMRLYGTRISKDGQTRLREQLANTNVDVRRGGFLGISPLRNLAPCTIGQVHPNTAAEAAGLQTNDTILEYNGQPVTDFDSLTKLISDNGPGETSTLLIERGGEKLTKQVTLGECKPSMLRQ
ncbi:MAG: PDZ domain-containing protein [Planctomycetales bacterium]|nr:PDZ domain-containing protein [Planctomycetales bacterium]